MAPTRHAVAVVLGETGVLVTGPSGAGKTAVGLALVDRWRRAGGFAALVADDRVVLEAAGGRLIARAPAPLAGLAERRGRGIVAVPHVPACVVGLHLALGPPRAVPRMPEDAAFAAAFEGVAVAAQPAPAGRIAEAVALAEAALEAAGVLLPAGNDGGAGAPRRGASGRLRRRLFLRRRRDW